jgi:purine-binding chemotaxis protein CheW
MSQKQYASFYIGKNLFGIDVRLIREITRSNEITSVDGAPNFVRGLLNLRGQIVTVIDVHDRMGLPVIDGADNDRHYIILKTSDELDAKREEDKTIEMTSRDLSALEVDSIGDMVTVEDNEIESTPANIGEVEGRFISGVVKLEKELLIIIKVYELLRNEDERSQK